MSKIPCAFLKGVDKAIPAELDRVPAAGEWVELIISGRVVMSGTVMYVKNEITVTNFPHCFQRTEVFLA